MSSSVLDSADVTMNKADKNLSSGVEILVGDVSAMEKKEGVVGESWVGGGVAVERAVRVGGELAEKIVHGRVEPGAGLHDQDHVQVPQHSDCVDG